MKKSFLLLLALPTSVLWGQEKASNKDKDSLKEVRERTIDPIIMVGYGTKKKIEVTGAVSQIKGDAIKVSPAANYTSSLAGRMPGLVINQRTSDPGQENIDVLIRGRGTFGNNSALIVIDGVASRDGLARLDPQDIETISVLKDASASIYGARAANGVILITTKRGKSGKPLITFSTNTSVSTPTSVVKGANPYDYAFQTNATRVRSGQAPLYSQDDLNKFQSPNFNGIDFWRGLFDKQSIQKRHSLSVQGGTDDVKYFASLGTTNQSPIMNYDDVTGFKQYNVRSNVDFTINENLKLGVDLAGRLEDITSPPYAFFAVDNAAKVFPINEKYIVGGKFIRLLENQNNPYSYITNQAGKDSNENTLFNGTLKLDYNFPFLKGLSFAAWGAVDYSQNYTNSFRNNPFQYILQDDGSLTKNPLGLDVSVEETYFKQRSLTYNMKLGFKRKFGVHSVDAFVAFEENKSKYNSSNLFRRGGLISESLPYVSQGDPSTQIANSSLGEGSTQAYIGRFSYDYAGKYLATFGFRRDGSYIFPAGKRFGFFPSVSAGWVVSKEKFLENNKTISLLKLRGSWGITGSNLVGAFQYLQRFQNPPQGGGVFYLSPDASNSNGIPLGNVNEIILSRVGVDPNPNITWEKSTSLDIGLELGLFSNNLNFEIDYFNAKRRDILARRNISVPQYTGLRIPDENIGRTENHGFEVSSSYKTNIGAVEINIGGNFTYAQNKLVFNDSPKPEEDYQQLQGRPIGSILLYNAIGIYRSQADLDKYPFRPGTEIGDLIYADTNGDGQITTADRIVLEKTNTPTTQYGVTLDLIYKNFELSTFWQGQSGSVIQLASYSYGADYFMANAWTPNTPNAILPAIGGTKTTFNGYDNYENNFFLKSTSFIRLKNVQLAYNIPQTVLKVAGIKNCKIFISGSNLLTFSKFNKFNLGDVEQGGLRDGLRYDRPLRKLYNIGLEVSF